MEEAKQMDRATLEAEREKSLDQLAFAKARLKQVTQALAEGNATDEDVDEAERSVRSLERKLEGLGYCEERVEAREKDEAIAGNLARRRENAVTALSLAYQLGWAIEGFEKDFAAAAASAREIEKLENSLRLCSTSLQNDDNRRNFTNAVGADDVLGTSARIYRSLEPLPRFSESFPTMLARAIQAYAREIPDVEDEAVQKEALALARRETNADEDPEG